MLNGSVPPATGAVNVFANLPIVFDSMSIAERDRLGFAREEYGRKALKVELEASPDAPFRLRMYAEAFGEVQVSVIRSTPYRVARTRPLVGDGDDRLGFVFPLAGRFRGEQDGRRLTLGPGEATVLASNRPGWFGTATGGAFLTILASPELAHPLARDMDDRTGRAIRTSRRGFDLLRAYVSAITREGAEIPPVLSDVAGRHLAEIAAHAIAAPEPSSEIELAGEGLRMARVALARAHMAARFSDPSYDVSACAGHLGLSVRSLQAILAAEGTSFSAELKRLRLEHARRLLADRENSGRRVSDIALDCGFTDISHFTRQFRARFGETPTSARGA